MNSARCKAVGVEIGGATEGQRATGRKHAIKTQEGLAPRLLSGREAGIGWHTKLNQTAMGPTRAHQPISSWQGKSLRSVRSSALQCAPMRPASPSYFSITSRQSCLAGAGSFPALLGFPSVCLFPARQSIWSHWLSGPRLFPRLRSFDAARGQSRRSPAGISAHQHLHLRCFLGTAFGKASRNGCDS